MRAIITTTINEPLNLIEWRAHLNDDDVIIVAGDQKSPHQRIEQLLKSLPGRNFYLNPGSQTHWASSAAIGWNSIQRRNIAVLEAIKFQPEFITTIDDDNYPVGDDWFNQHRPNGQGIPSGTGWFNPGVLCSPRVTHRGLPMSQRHSMETNNWSDCEDTNLPADDESIGVWASMWLGDPDVDATERIARDPRVTKVVGAAIPDFGTWAPFNSQSTTYRACLAPLMMVWPFVGRFDDIWGSYLARAVMDPLGWRVYYGAPLVRQKRNEHDLLKDLKGELFGYEHTPALIDHLRHMAADITDAERMLREMEAPTARTDTAVIAGIMAGIVSTFDELKFLPSQLRPVFNAWFTDLDTVYTALEEKERNA